ncbi:MAG: MoxR family ATPase [Lachnospiraceae bacterium]|nr:MoxR family ATPase [Lachnospiraceae bacterium]
MRNKALALKDGVNRFFVGKEEVTEDVIICLLSGGHVLLEDVPGVGKTTLALSLARSMKCSFGRLQFTPDTLPSDVSGMSVYRMNTGEFVYQPGVVMNNVVLADEINRTSPKTQAGLLEAMEELKVTVDNVVHPLPEPFLVIATQNPVEFLGTYPLPEAQLDRFMMRLSIGYPGREEELSMAEKALSGELYREAEAVADAADVLAMREEAASVYIAEEVLAYMNDIVRATREEKQFAYGASPRAFIQLARAAKAKAYLSGRDFVKPDDVKDVAEKVLSHRISLSPEARIRKASVSEILRNLIIKTRVPV